MKNSLREIGVGVIAALIGSAMTFFFWWLVNWETNKSHIIFSCVLLELVMIAIVYFFMARREQARFISRTHHHHMFVHTERDLIVGLFGDATIYNRQPGEPIVPKVSSSLLKEMLRRVAKTYQHRVPRGTKVFASIRERRGNEYVTILRAGEVDDTERQLTSKPLKWDYQMVELLRNSFHDKKDCVLLTGSKELSWHQMPNDGREEDLSVLMGAVFTKRLKKGITDIVPDSVDNFDPIELEWILCVAASKRGVFKESDKSLMKCFNDGFGLLLNVFKRRAWDL